MKTSKTKFEKYQTSVAWAFVIVIFWLSVLTVLALMGVCKDGPSVDAIRVPYGNIRLPTVSERVGECKTPPCLMLETPSQRLIMTDSAYTPSQVTIEKALDSIRRKRWEELGTIADDLTIQPFDVLGDGYWYRVVVDEGRLGRRIVWKCQFQKDGGCR